MNLHSWLVEEVGDRKTVYLKKFSRLALVLIFGYLYFEYVFPHLLFGIETVAAIGLVFFFLVLAVSGYAPVAGRKHLDRQIWLPVLLAISLVIILPFAFMRRAFGSFDINSLLMTFGENDFNNLAAVGLDGFVFDFLKILVIIVAIITTAVIILRAVHLSRILIGFCAILPFAFGPVTHYFYQLNYPSQAHSLIDTKSVSLPPQILTKPEVKKNVVIVYLESLERTYREIPDTKEAFSELAKLEDSGLSFRNIHQVNGTGITIGGMIATQCGVPLMPKGIFHMKRFSPNRVDRLPSISGFLSGLTCLGDILSSEGYRATYINGSDLTIYSKGNFYRSHGYQRILGLSDYPGWEEEPRQNTWGMNDDLLFERVSYELRKLAGTRDPFILTTLTIATHGPDAFLDGSCPVDENSGNSGIIDAIKCTGNHVSRLIDEINRLGISDNTMVVIASDHLAFRNTLAEQLAEHEDMRRNYMVIMGAEMTGAIERDGSALDIYPTILELLGYKLKDGRAGLGYSLLSNSTNLVEKHGAELVSEAIYANSALQKAIWANSKISP